jgi:ABC-type transport system involved in multi-copper enzyme maturation permease subunit
MNRMLALSYATFLEGIRNRSVYGIFIFSLLVFGLNVVFSGFFMRDIGKVAVDLNMSALNLAGLLFVLFVGINLISKDIDRKNILLILSKPYSRGEYLFGKYIGLSFCLILVLTMLLVFSSVSIIICNKISPDYFLKFKWTNYFISFLFIFIQFAVLNSIIIFFSSLTSSSFITLIFTVCVYIAGISIEEVISYLKSSFVLEQMGNVDNLLLLLNVVSYLIPNFSALDFRFEAAHGLPLDYQVLAFSFLYATSYIVLVLMVSSFLFRKREFC